MGESRYQFRGALTSYGFGLILSLVAIDLTYYVPLFTRIPWTLSFCAVAMVAWIGGVPAALMTAVISGFGIYALILVPGSPRHYELASAAQAIAFFLIALLIAYLVSQRNRALESLKESEMHYRSVTETASDVILTIDGDSCILGINPAVKTVFGYEPSELVGKKMLVLMPERYRAAHTAGIERHLATGVRHIPWTGVQLPGQRKDRQEIPLEISFGSYNAHGKRRFTGFIRDISDRQKAEAALMHSEKLAAVGRLASSIAHEINNPLEAVTNLLFLSQRSADLAEVHSYLDMAEREVRRISVIANQTLQFHKHSGKPSQALCEALIAGSLTLYKVGWPTLLFLLGSGSGQIDLRCVSKVRSGRS